MFAVEKRLPSRARVKRSWTQRASTRKDGVGRQAAVVTTPNWRPSDASGKRAVAPYLTFALAVRARSEEHTSELQSRLHLVCRLLLEKKKKIKYERTSYCTYVLHANSFRVLNDTV